MKYIITENQLKFIVENDKLDTLVSKYLNFQDWWTWDIGNGEFNVADGEYGKDIFRFRIQNSSTFPDHEFNVIYIEDDLVSKIITLFGLNNKIIIGLIINWFNQKYNKNLNINDFEWMEHDDRFDIDDEDYEQLLSVRQNKSLDMIDGCATDKFNLNLDKIYLCPKKNS